MQIPHPHTLLIFAWLAIGQLCTGCSAEDIAGEAPSEMGVLCLQMSSGEDFVQVETRAEQTLTDFTGYKFTLSNGEEISFTDGKAIIPAGTYKLSATNANADAVDGGYGGPLYSGSSDEFTVTAGGTTPVTLSLGAPQNAKVTIELSSEFTGLYTFSSLTLKEGEKGHTLTSAEQVAYFPATNTTLSYTLVANAKQYSHVQDITGASGTVTIAPGTHTTLTLDVNPIDPNLITIVTGDPYNGEFQ
ncbi:MAG: DUF4493 domain-containing protein [Bacteroidaceae bacterium]|nr:DUF4493 domain-containing protein [Bacteroidaceae bacterium]